MPQKCCVVKGKMIQDTKDSFCLSWWVAFLKIPRCMTLKVFPKWQSHVAAHLSATRVLNVMFYRQAQVGYGMSKLFGRVSYVAGVMSNAVFTGKLENSKHQLSFRLLDVITGHLSSHRFCFCSRWLLVLRIILRNLLKPRTDRAVA